jgi:peptidoglycan/xylan/chitin deacetylase (PgdA/CDA1 family)
MKGAFDAVPYILVYHSVADPAGDPYGITVSPQRFEHQLRWLRARGLRGVSMRELLAARACGQGAGLVGLTFDDGYADFAVEVVPVLARHRFTATVFVVADLIGGHNEWDPDGPRKDLMTRRQIRQVAAEGMEIGSHTLSHPSLTQAAESELAHELAKSRAVLCDLVGEEVGGFAYPYGHATGREVEAVGRAGYRYACAVRRPAQLGELSLPRTYVGDGDGWLRLDAKRLRHRMCGRRTR